MSHLPDQFGQQKPSPPMFLAECADQSERKYRPENRRQLVQRSRAKRSEHSNVEHDTECAQRCRNEQRYADRESVVPRRTEPQTRVGKADSRDQPQHQGKQTRRAHQTGEPDGSECPHAAIHDDKELETPAREKHGYDEEQRLRSGSRLRHSVPDSHRPRTTPLRVIEEDIALLLPVQVSRATRWELIAFGAVDRKSTRLNSSHVKISYAVF